MSTAKRKPSTKGNRNAIPAIAKAGEDESLVIGRTVLRPTVQAAITLRDYDKAFADISLPGLIDALTEETKAIIGGDLHRSEAMLVAQAHTLDAIFNNLAQRAAMNMGEYLGATESYLKLALRAQSQCRATWEALATLKNPPMMGYVRQANIAHGPQQVNNASAAHDGAPRAGENRNLQSKLLEENDGQRLDTGTPCTPSRVDSAMAPVGKSDRSKNPGR